MAETQSSTPSLTQFNPHDVPWQVQPIIDIRKNFDYGLGAHELLFSGAAGSAKSILGAHLVVTHCLMNPRARVCLGRKSLKDIKDTIYTKILEHIEGDLVEGKDYWLNWTHAEVRFSNGSEIISRSWHDKNFKKFRSLELSAALVEELTENDEEEKLAIEELSIRVGRLPHVKESWILFLTNPDDPEHWVYRDIIEKAPENPTRRIYYSVTSDNKFLPPAYVERLKRNLDPETAKRMIYGQWVPLGGGGIYHAYKKEVHYRTDRYQIDPKHPVRIAWDFNIGDNKPLSLVCFQYINDHFHFFKEIVVEGARTQDSCDELADSGLLDIPGGLYIIHGDATGRHRDTRNRRSDYGIIEDFFANYKTPQKIPVKFSVQVPVSNPPVRERHNMVNGYLENCNGAHRVTLWGCKTLDQGFRLTKLKKGGSYIEDDSKPYQHITTAAGYGIYASLRYFNNDRGRTIGR